VAREQNKIKTVVDFVDAIFDGDAGHALGAPEWNRAYGIEN
jgi:hypothetical protein